MSVDDVRDAYGRWAEEYADLFASTEAMHELVLGLVEGARVEPFAHTVTTAYFWSIEEMSQRLADAGFEVEATESRADGKRPHAAIIARRVLVDR